MVYRVWLIRKSGARDLLFCSSDLARCHTFVVMDAPPWPADVRIYVVGKEPWAAAVEPKTNGWIRRKVP